MFQSGSCGLVQRWTSLCLYSQLLQEKGVCMHTSAEEEIVREMKEKCCCVALNYEAELSGRDQTCKEMKFTLPDGREVTVGSERFR